MYHRREFAKVDDDEIKIFAVLMARTDHSRLRRRICLFETALFQNENCLISLLF